jgi:phage terminase large subunit-like protein
MGMRKLGLISNTLSQGNRKGLDAISAVASGSGQVLHERLTTIAQLTRILAGFVHENVDIIAVNGGDGTVQAVLTELFEARPFTEIPPLAILAGGMTNTNAKDIGFRGAPAKALSQLIALVRQDRLDDHLIRRHVLRIENVAGHSAQRAMFFGSAGIVRAIEVCRERVHARGLQANWANGVTLVGLLLGWIFGKERSETFRGDNIAISFDGAPMERDIYLVVLATTLDQIIVRSRPFWNAGEGHVRFTSIAYPPKRLLRYAFRILYGGPDRELPETTYRSRTTRRAVLEMDCPFTLDGQFYEPSEDKPVVITADDEVCFIKP